MEKFFLIISVILILFFSSCNNVEEVTTQPTTAQTTTTTQPTTVTAIPTTQATTTTQTQNSLTTHQQHESYNNTDLIKECGECLNQVFKLELPKNSKVKYFSNKSNFVAKITVTEEEFDSFLGEIQNENWRHTLNLNNRINHLSTIYKNWDLQEENVFGFYYKFYTATMPNGARCTREKSIYISKAVKGIHDCYFVI